MATLQIRIDDTIKKQADTLFSSLGLDTSTAIRIFLNASIENAGIPFSVQHKAIPYQLQEAASEEISMALLIMHKMPLPPCWRINLCIRLSTRIA